MIIDVRIEYYYLPKNLEIKNCSLFNLIFFPLIYFQLIKYINLDTIQIVLKIHLK